MKLTKLLLTSTTALGLSMTAAFADGNEALLDQTGNNNQSAITQSDGSDNKAFVSPDGGTTKSDLLQRGDSNSLVLTQTGDNNEVGIAGGNFGTGGGAAKFDQNNENAVAAGDLNTATILQSTSGNSIRGVDQRVFAGQGGNTLTITQKGGDDNLTGSVTQRQFNNSISSSDGQTIEILQDGSSNVINAAIQFFQGAGAVSGNEMSIDIIGSNNNGGQSVGSDARAGYNGGGQFRQTGAGNFMDVDITGNGNGYGIRQNGSGNTVGTLVVTGNNNEFGIDQLGTDNEVLVVGVIIGDENDFGVNQNGVSNLLDVDMFAGDMNSLLVDQDGDDNTSDVTIDGNMNDGDITQGGSGSNMASLLQVGDGNTAVITQ